MKNIMNKILLICVAVMLLYFFSGSGIPAIAAQQDIPEADYCSFVIPSEYVPSSEKGLFVHRDRPMESSSIKYSYYDNGEDVLLTNRQKAELTEKEKDASKEDVEEVMSEPTDQATSLTRDIYEATLSAAYNSEYGSEVGFSVSSFEDINIDGYPGYKIDASYKPGERETVYQTVYMFISKYRTFTVTFQRASDDECEEVFEECASTFHIH